MKKSIITTALILCSLMSFCQLHKNPLVQQESKDTMYYTDNMDSIQVVLEGIHKKFKIVSTNRFDTSIYYQETTPPKNIYDTVPCIMWLADTSRKHVTAIIYQVRGFEVRHINIYQHWFAIDGDNSMGYIHDKYLDYKKRTIPPRFMIPFSFPIK